MIEKITLPIHQVPTSFPKTVLAGPGSCAVFRLGETLSKEAVVFVHGFLGNPVTSWGDFLQLAENSEDFKEKDVYFYGFKTFFGPQTDILANQLDYFFQRLESGSIREFLLRGFLLGPSPLAKYQRITLVAHSLGGVILRLAALKASTPQLREWVKKSRIVLFAPAHLGAYLSLLVKEAGGLLKINPLDLVQLLATPVARDLDPDKSTLLKTLREETEAFAKENSDPQHNAYRASCVFGVNEFIVIAGNFKYDLRFSPDPGDHDHWSICKPSLSWTFPIEFLK